MRYKIASISPPLGSVFWKTGVQNKVCKSGLPVISLRADELNQWSSERQPSFNI